PGALSGGDLVWLAASTPCDALETLDAALGGGADPIWNGVAASVEETLGGTRSRAEAIVAAAALGASHSETARRLASDLAARVDDAALGRLLRGPGPASDLSGEIAAAP